MVLDIMGCSLQLSQRVSWLPLVAELACLLCSLSSVFFSLLLFLTRRFLHSETGLIKPVLTRRLFDLQFLSCSRLPVRLTSDHFRNRGSCYPVKPARIRLGGLITRYHSCWSVSDLLKILVAEVMIYSEDFTQWTETS